MNWQQPSPNVISIRTIVRIVLAIGAVWLLLELRHVLLLIAIAFLIAAALAPPVQRLEDRGWPLPIAVAIVITGLVAILSVIVWYVVPQLVAQGETLVENMPGYIDQAQVFLRRYPALNERLQGYFDPGSAQGGAVSVPVSRVVAYGTAVVQGLLDTFLVLVMAVYLLLDGERISRGILRLLNPVHQEKFRRAMPEIVNVVSGYVVGQALTSFLFGAFAFAILTALHVPQPMLLAVLAAVMDAVPIFGVPLATIPAVLAGLTVSVPVAISVLVLYVVYQQIENYLLVPRIYGRTLHVSPFSVLLGVLVGGELLGVVGVLLALPLTATIPIVVRLWREDVDDKAEAPVQLTLREAAHPMGGVGPNPQRKP
ncbi:MAG TPA: AI-2E family transporter [Thermomicrobiales bacterium]|nr:AI-2E family transporter [Thermomicrobiales bacterium]